MERGKTYFHSVKIADERKHPYSGGTFVLEVYVQTCLYCCISFSILQTVQVLTFFLDLHKLIKQALIYNTSENSDGWAEVGC